MQYSCPKCGRFVDLQDADTYSTHHVDGRVVSSVHSGQQGTYRCRDEACPIRDSVNADIDAAIGEATARLRRGHRRMLIAFLLGLFGFVWADPGLVRFLLLFFILCVLYVWVFAVWLHTRREIKNLEWRR